MGLLYSLASAALTLGITLTVVMALIVGYIAYHNVGLDPVTEGRPRRKWSWRTPLAILIVGALLIGLGAYFSRVEVTQTTLGALGDQGRTTGLEGFTTEEELYQQPVTETASLQVPGVSPNSLINKAIKYFGQEKTTVNVEVGIYGLVNFKTKAAQNARTMINPATHTITVNLPTPTKEKTVYSVADVKVTQGLGRAIGTFLIGVVKSLIGKPIISTNIASEVNKAEAAAAARANPAEVYGCGRLEIQQQLAALFGTIPQYKGWAVIVNFPGMRSVPQSVCAALQAKGRLVTSS